MDKEHKYAPLVFQENPDYQKPVYPSKWTEQQQMLHLDLYVNQDELKKGRARFSLRSNISRSAYLDDCKVIFDPSGHPFLPVLYCFIRVTPPPLLDYA